MLTLVVIKNGKESRKTEYTNPDKFIKESYSLSKTVGFFGLECIVLSSSCSTLKVYKDSCNYTRECDCPGHYRIKKGRLLLRNLSPIDAIAEFIESVDRHPEEPVTLSSKERLILSYAP